MSHGWHIRTGTVHVCWMNTERGITQDHGGCCKISTSQSVSLPSGRERTCCPEVCGRAQSDLSQAGSCFLNVSIFAYFLFSTPLMHLSKDNPQEGMMILPENAYESPLRSPPNIGHSQWRSSILHVPGHSRLLLKLLQNHLRATKA